MKIQSGTKNGDIKQYSVIFVIIEGCIGMSLKESIQKILDDWETLETSSCAEINQFLDKWEPYLCYFGHFVKGLRVRPVYDYEEKDSFHHTINGMLGILSMNMEVLSTKANKH